MKSLNNIIKKIKEVYARYVQRETYRSWVLSR